jgi:hypothetical protein
MTMVSADTPLMFAVGWNALDTDTWVEEEEG